MGGLLALAIYNDQGPMSRIWTRFKSLYNRRGRPTRRAIVTALWARYLFRRAGTTVVRRALHLPPPPATRTDRGMAVSTDIVDWAGGYPFEVAKPEEVFRFVRDRGFTLVGLSTVAGDLGCNEFVFRRT
jgi:2-polyprenyl-6-hydroxyphenyl methylase/3-demethylubiquinone-9 3-methyltransferase